MTDSTAKSSGIFYLSTSTGTATPGDYAAGLSMMKLEAAVFSAPVEINRGSTVIETATAPWFGTVQRRLNASIGAAGSAELASGASLSSEVVSAANSFFAAASAILPSEPYLYGMPNGKLVAEFVTSGAPLTVVFSDRSALAMSTIDGETVHAKIPLEARTAAAVQEDLTAFTSNLRAKHHVPLETGR